MNLLLNESVNNIKPYQRDLTIDLQISDTQKIQLTVAIDFIFTRGSEEEHTMHPSSDNTKLTSHNDVNEAFDELFDSLCSRTKGNLQTSMRGSDFIFDSAKMTYYKCDKAKFRCSG